MEFLATITALLSTVDLFFTVKERFTNKPNKDTTVVWLSETADLIESVAEDLKNRIYPHSKCAQLQFYLHNFYDIIKNDLKEDQAGKVLIDIEEAYKVERLLAELNNISDDEKDKNLIKLHEIAGKFRGLSEFLKFS